MSAQFLLGIGVGGGLMVLFDIAVESLTAAHHRRIHPAAPVDEGPAEDPS